VAALVASERALTMTATEANIIRGRELGSHMEPARVLWPTTPQRIRSSGGSLALQNYRLGQCFGALFTRQKPADGSIGVFSWHCAWVRAMIAS
jgi:hypothetical protein